MQAEISYKFFILKEQEIEIAIAKAGTVTDHQHLDIAKVIKCN